MFPSDLQSSPRIPPNQTATLQDVEHVWPKGEEQDVGKAHYENFGPHVDVESTMKEDKESK